MIGSVHIIDGMRKGVPVRNITFPLVASLQADGNGLFVTVDGSGMNGYPQRQFRVTVVDPTKLVINLKPEFKHLYQTGSSTPSSTPVASVRNTTNDLGANLKPYVTEIAWPDAIQFPFEGLPPIDDNPLSDDEILDRIANQFIMLRKIVGAIRDDQAKGVIVYGGPGTGKSFEVEDELKKGRHGDKHFLIIKGYVTAAALFQLLYDNQSRVLVFDDSDSVLDDEDSMNLLKAALDTTEARILSWNTAGGLDKTYPRTFEYKGRIIFITNKNFEKIIEVNRIAEEKGRSVGKMVPHLNALMSRCDYLDLTMDTLRERYLRIQQVTRNSRMLVNKGCTPLESEEVLGFMRQHIHELRELSLRTAIRIGGYIKIDRKGWVEMAHAYCLKRKKL